MFAMTLTFSLSFTKICTRFSLSSYSAVFLIFIFLSRAAQTVALKRRDKEGPGHFYFNSLDLFTLESIE